MISYNSANDIPSPVEGNGEINASSSSSSISSGECYNVAAFHPGSLAIDVINTAISINVVGLKLKA